MFHANYYSNDAKVYRWMMAQHYVDCVECGRPVCGHFAKQTYADDYSPCPYRYDWCDSGSKHEEDGRVLCAICY